MRLCSGTDLTTEELAELNQVGTVTLAGIVAEMPLEFEVIEELPDQRRETLL